MPDILMQFLVLFNIGAFNTAGGLTMISSLSEFLSMHYILTNLLGCLFGFSFVLHHPCPFKNQAQAGQKKQEFVQFILIFLIAYFVQLLVLIGGVHHLDLASSMRQILAIGIYVMINYLGTRYAIFAKTGKV